MNFIILSGGSGRRLWPLSNEIRSKQFIKIFRQPDGSYESMLQCVYRQIKMIDKESNIIIATSKSQVSSIHNQLGEDVGISVEPCRRDTFPAIALATAYLHDVQGVDKNDAVVVCPVDPYVDKPYFETLKNMYDVAKHSQKKLILMGIEPTYPSEKYGYIIPFIDEKKQRSFTFTEKPAEEMAEEYIKQEALWNGGVFAYKLKYVLEQSDKLLGTSNYISLVNKYPDFEKNSFDYAVVEKEKSLEVVQYKGTWKDLGTWNTLTEAMEEPTIGDVRLSKTCENVHVINELGVPILVMGGKDLIISASPEGMLVSDKEESSYIKPFVNTINQQVMFAEKSWGNFKVIDIENESLTIKVTLNPGHSMNYHSHEKRDEVWIVILGSGLTIVDGKKQQVKTGDVMTMPAGRRHTIIAGENGLQLIEVQLGRDINVSDKHKYAIDDLTYN